jgi:hypothetical protein
MFSTGERDRERERKREREREREREKERDLPARKTVKETLYSPQERERREAMEIGREDVK